jgi:hypothetical protein
MTEGNAAIDSGIVRVFVEGYAPGAPECQTVQFEVFLGEDVERLRERAAGRFGVRPPTNLRMYTCLDSGVHWLEEGNLASNGLVGGDVVRTSLRLDFAEEARRNKTELEALRELCRAQKAEIERLTEREADLVRRNRALEQAEIKRGALTVPRVRASHPEW